MSLQLWIFEWRIERWIWLCHASEQIIQILIIINSRFFSIVEYEYTKTAIIWVVYRQTHMQRQSTGFSHTLAVALALILSNDKCRCIKMLKYAWLIYLAIWCVFMCNKFLKRTTHTYTQNGGLNDEWCGRII